MIPTEPFFFLLNHEFSFENKEKSRSEILRGELLTYSLCLKDLSETLELKFLPAVPWVKLQIPLSVTFLQHLASHKISERDLSFNENCVPPAFCQGNQGDVNVSVSRQISHPSYSLYGCDRRGVGWSFLHHYFNYFPKKIMIMRQNIWWTRYASKKCVVCHVAPSLHWYLDRIF